MRFLLPLALAAATALAQPVLAQPAPSGPAGHRLLFAPTARAVPAGEWRLGVTELLVPTASAGLGSGVSLGAGVLVGPAPVESGIVFVEPKLTLVERPGLAVALGATSRVDPASARGVDASVFPHAVATVGRGRLASTVGLGARVNVRRALTAEPLPGPTVDPLPAGPGPYALDLVPAPAVFAGAELGFTRRASLLLEATALPDGGATNGGFIECATGLTAAQVEAYIRQPTAPSTVRYTLTGGAAARYATRRVALDLGLAVVRTDDGGAAPLVEPAPWLNVTVGLGS